MGNNIKISGPAVRKLVEDFELSNAEIARIYGCTREYIRILNNIENNYKQMEIEKIDEKEFVIINNMILKKMYEYENDEIQIKLINDLKEKFVFIIKKKSEVKAIFSDNLGDDKYRNVVEKIKAYRLNTLKKEEMELIDKSDVLIIMKKECFHPYDYKKFHKYRNLRQMTEKEYSQFLGYEDYASSMIENTDEKIIEFFDNNLVDGKVYISSNVNWIRNYASRQNMLLEDFVRFFGYIKYNNSNRKLKKEENKIVDKSLLHIKALLEKIRIQQKNKDNIRIIEENKKIIADRNISLIKDLKEIYTGKCQICKNIKIPQIIQKDGTIYCEAHHIEELANFKINNIEEENFVFDNYKNIIILCPFHHKYLHYQKGGKYKLQCNNEKLYLVNEYEELKIEYDYHLKENFI